MASYKAEIEEKIRAGTLDLENLPPLPLLKSLLKRAGGTIWQFNLAIEDPRDFDEMEYIRSFASLGQREWSLWTEKYEDEVVKLEQILKKGLEFFNF